MQVVGRRMLAGLVVVILAACNRAAAPPEPSGGNVPPPAAPVESRTLVAAIRLEPSSVAGRPLRTAGVGLYLPRRMFNAEMAFLDDRAQTQPYLIEADWHVFPDGRMVEGFARTLERGTREQQVTQLVRILTEDVQSISLFIRVQAWTHVAELRGLSLAPPEGNMSWSIHQWELR